MSALGDSAANQRLGHAPVGADKGSPPLLAAVENLLEVGKGDWLVGGLRRDPCEVEPDTHKREPNSDRQCAAAWWPIEWSNERVLVTTMQAGGIADGAIARAVAGESGNEGRVTSARGNARRLARGVASAFLRRLANDTDDDTEARAHRERALAIEAGDAPPTQNRRRADGERLSRATSSRRCAAGSRNAPPPDHRRAAGRTHRTVGRYDPR